MGLFQAFTTPIWAFYDETTHYEYIYFIRENGRRPVDGETIPGIYERFIEPLASYDEYKEVTDPCEPTAAHCLEIGKSGWQFDELPGYYLINAAAWNLTGAQTVVEEVRVSRILSVLMSALIGLMAYIITRTAFPERPYLAIATPLLLGIITGYLTTMSSLNNDAGAVFAVCIVLLASTLILRQPRFAWGYALLFVGLAFCLQMKATSLLGLPIAVGALLLVFINNRTLLRLAGYALPVVVVLLMIVILFFGPALLAITGIFDQVFAISGGVNLSALVRNLLRSVGEGTVLAYIDPLIWLFVTFWSTIASGVPSYTRLMNVVPLLFSVLAVFGLLRWWFTEDHDTQTIKLFVLFEAAVLLAFLMHVMRIQPGGYIPTARHYYVAIIPTILLLLLGLSSIHPRTRKLLPGVFILVLFGLNLIAILNVQVPYFQLLDYTFLY